METRYEPFEFFFDQEHYCDYVLGFNLGNAKHDMAVFVRKNNGFYELVHFDPNDGAISNTMNGFVHKLGKKVLRKGSMEWESRWKMLVLVLDGAVEICFIREKSVHDGEFT